jgi:hypothetical protein
MLTNMRRLEIGGGRVEMQSGVANLEIPATSHGYADAQLDDYQGLARGAFSWRPPLTFSLNARASSPAPNGTLGFGFWNDPVALSLGGGGAVRRLPAAPQAAWFFYGSPPNDLSFGGDWPGAGWLAMTMRSRHIPSLLLIPAAAAGFMLASLRIQRRLLFRLIRSVLSVESATLDIGLEAWHNYRIDWKTDQVDFFVDGEPILHTTVTPRPPLGLVLWIDNQFLCASPSAGLRFGVLPTVAPQRLELESPAVETHKAEWSAAAPASGALA